MPPAHFGAVAILAALLLGVARPDAHARSFRVQQIPNGLAANCANCHVNPAGGGTRTPFGAAVNTAIGGTSANVAFWNATLAALDSDGDGVSNGGELLDPDGDGTPTGNVGVTNPGNRPPAFTMPPVTAATMGLSYQYQATAIDSEANGFTFSKVSGPTWLTVSSAGLASGIPPAGSAGGHLVTLRVTDFGTSTKGYSMSSSTRTYTLNVTSSYAGWQALNFTLPAEAALAAPLADPDSDGLVNLLEYAVRLPARALSSSVVFTPTTDAEGRLALVLQVRDDDPRLALVMEADADPSFPAPVTIAPTIADPVPGDGFWEYTFVDTIAPAPVAARFVRIRVELLP
jgi:hypothetical protein